MATDANPVESAQNPVPQPVANFAEGSVDAFAQKQAERRAAAAPQQLEIDASEDSAPEPQQQADDSTGSEAPITDDTEGTESEAEVDATDAEIEQEADSVDTEAEQDAADVLELDADELQEIMGVPVSVDDDGQMRVSVKVDGKESDATLTELVERYQRDATLTNRSKALAEKERTLEDNRAAFDTQAHQQHAELATLLQAAKELLNPFSGIDLDQLKQHDPTEWVVKTTEKERWERQIADVIQRGKELMGQQLTEQNDRSQQALQVEAEKAETRVKELIPDWGDAKRDELLGYMESTYKIDPKSLTIAHPELVDAVRKAKLYDEGKAKAETKRVRKVPRVVKAKARKQASKAAASAKVIDTAAAAHQKAGSMDSFVDLMRARRSRSAKTA